MNILVTGGSGFIGSRVVDKLLLAGHNVRILDIKPPRQDGVEYFAGDITAPGDVAASMADVEVVYHLAAFSNIDLVKADPLRTVEFNIMGTAYLLEEARKKHLKRFIYAGSVYVYDERGHLYTTSKLASEMLCRNYQTLYGLPYTILRYGTAYGPGSRDADVVSIFVRRVLEGKDLIIRGTGDQKRHFIYVDDLAEGNVAALAAAAANRTYTLIRPRAISIRSLARTVKTELHCNVDVVFEPSREDDHTGSLPDVKKNTEAFRRELNWYPATGIAAGVRKYADWYQHRNTLT